MSDPMANLQSYYLFVHSTSQHLHLLNAVLFSPCVKYKYSHFDTPNIHSRPFSHDQIPQACCFVSHYVSHNVSHYLMLSQTWLFAFLYKSNQSSSLFTISYSSTNYFLCSHFKKLSLFSKNSPFLCHYIWRADSGLFFNISNVKVNNTLLIYTSLWWAWRHY